MLRLNKHPIGDTHPLYQTFKGLLERPGKPATDVIVKILRAGKNEEEEDAFEDLFSRNYKAADLGDEVVYYRNYIEGQTLKEYLTGNKPNDDTVMELSTKLLSMLNFLHIEKKFHNKLNSEHILLQGNQIYIISADNSLSNSSRKDIEAFGEVLNEMLGTGQKAPFYRDILVKCRGGSDYFRNVSDILYRFKNRVSKIENIPASFDKYVVNQFNKHGYPPSKATRDSINAQAYRMAIDEHLIDPVITRNGDRVRPPKTSVPRWAYLIIPIFLVLGVGLKLLTNKGVEDPAELHFSLNGDEKKELGEAYSFASNQRKTKHLRWKVYDYNGRKIEQEENKNELEYTPEKPGKYFVTLEHIDDSKNIHKDTIQVMWPGGKAQFSVQQIDGNKFILNNESPFADSVFYDMGDGLVKMNAKQIEYEYIGITTPTDVTIQFAAYANGQADLQTKKFRATPPKNKAATPSAPITEPTPEKPVITPPPPKEAPTTTPPPPKEEPIVTPTPPKPKPEPAYKKPIIRSMKPNYDTQTIGLRLSSTTIDPNLIYEWEVSGEKKVGQTVTFSIENQNVMQVFVRAMKDGKVVHTSSKMVSVQPKKEDNSPFKSIKDTGLFKEN